MATATIAGPATETEFPPGGVITLHNVDWETYLKLRNEEGRQPRPDDLPRRDLDPDVAPTPP